MLNYIFSHLWDLITIIGLIIIFIYQKKKINYLKNKIDTAEKFMNIFNLDKIEKYVKISEKLYKKQAELVIENEKKKIQFKTKETIKYLFKEYIILYRYVLNLLTVFPFHPYIRKSISELPDEDIKNELSSFLRKIQEEYKKLFPNLTVDTSSIIATILMRSGQNLGN